MWLDLAGLGLLCGGVACIYVSAATAGVSPNDVILLYLLVAMSFVGARVIGSWRRSVVPGILIIIGVVMIVGSGSDIFSASPLKGPLGYVNARAGLFVQITIAGLAAVRLAASTVGKVVAAVAAIGAASVPLISGSVAASVLLCGGLVAAATVRTERHKHVAIAISALLFTVALVATTAVGVMRTQDPRTSDVVAVAERLLTAERLDLWRDATEIMVSRPLTGVGPWGFALASPTARGDADLRWAHHAFLQQGAEAGVFAMLTLVLTFLWGFVVLWTSSAPPGPTALAAVGLAILGIHATVDYVLHFAALPVVVAALVGSMAAPAMHRSGLTVRLQS